MKKDIELIKFNLTQDMCLELIRFNELKKQLYKLKELYNLDKNKELLKKINKLQSELNKSKNKFILEFRLNNKQEIIEYLKLKDHF